MTNNNDESESLPALITFDRRSRVGKLQILGLTQDRYAIRIRYRLQPAFGSVRPAGSDVGDWTAPILWTWHAEDDVGNEYLEAGGAYGTADGETAVQGVWSLVPLPSRSARRLHVVVTPWVQAGVEVEPYVFDVDLPDPGP